MAKTKEELNQLKIEYETLNNKLQELTEDELNAVTGGLKRAFLFGTYLKAANTDIQKGFVNQEDQQIVGKLPKINDDERYVM